MFQILFFRIKDIIFLGILKKSFCIKCLIFTVFDYLKNKKDLLTA